VAEKTTAYKRGSTGQRFVSHFKENFPAPKPEDLRQALEIPPYILKQPKGDQKQLDFIMRPWMRSDRVDRDGPRRNKTPPKFVARTVNADAYKAPTQEDLCKSFANPYRARACSSAGVKEALRDDTLSGCSRDIEVHDQLWVKPADPAMVCRTLSAKVVSSGADPRRRSLTPRRQSSASPSRSSMPPRPLAAHPQSFTAPTRSVTPPPPFNEASQRPPLPPQAETRSKTPPRYRGDAPRRSVEPRSMTPPRQSATPRTSRSRSRSATPSRRSLTPSRVPAESVASESLQAVPCPRGAAPRERREAAKPPQRDVTPPAGRDVTPPRGGDPTAVGASARGRSSSRSSRPPRDQKGRETSAPQPATKQGPSLACTTEHREYFKKYSYAEFVSANTDPQRGIFEPAQVNIARSTVGALMKSSSAAGAPERITSSMQRDRAAPSRDAHLARDARKAVKGEKLDHLSKEPSRQRLSSWGPRGKTGP